MSNSGTALIAILSFVCSQSYCLYLFYRMTLTKSQNPSITCSELRSCDSTVMTPKEVDKSKDSETKQVRKETRGLGTE